MDSYSSRMPLLMSISAFLSLSLILFAALADRNSVVLMTTAPIRAIIARWERSSFVVSCPDQLNIDVLISFRFIIYSTPIFQFGASDPTRTGTFWVEARDATINTTHAKPFFRGRNPRLPHLFTSPDVIFSQLYKTVNVQMKKKPDPCFGSSFLKTN